MGGGDCDVLAPQAEQATPRWKPYDLEIRPVLNGYIVKVGCQLTVFETLERMTKEIQRYYSDPKAVEKEYLEKH